MAAASFVAPGGLVANLIIPAGTVVQTQSETPVLFQLLSPLTLTPSQPNAIGTVENSTTQSETFAASGQPNQSLVSGQTPYLDGSSEVTDGSGNWTEVPNFLDSGSADKHYTISVDNNDRATLTYGDGINGQLPSGTITWVYKTGGGAAGNVEAASITKIDATLTDLLSNTVTVTVTNADASSGGTDRETVEHIKALAPQSITAPRTTVAREDYVTHALEVPGVARALMMTVNQDPAIPVNEGFLYVVPTVSPTSPIGFPTDVLLQKVKDQCTIIFPNTITFDLRVVAPVYLDIGVAATVYFTKGNSGIDPVAVAKRHAIKLAIIAALRGYFALSASDGGPNPAIDFGVNLANSQGEPAGNLPLSDLFDVVADVAGVRKISPLAAGFTINATRRIFSTPTGDVVVLAPGSHADAPIGLVDFPRLDGDVGGTPNVVIVDGDTGLTVA